MILHEFLQKKISGYLVTHFHHLLDQNNPIQKEEIIYYNKLEKLSSYYQNLNFPILRIF